MHNIDLTLPLYTTSLNSITSELRTTQTIALLGRTEVRIRGGSLLTWFCFLFHCLIKEFYRAKYFDGKFHEDCILVTVESIV
jgi:hypothetical protein